MPNTSSPTAIPLTSRPSAATVPETSQPTVKGGLLQGKKIDNAQLKRLASLPSREQMLADLGAGMQSPMAAFVGALNGLLYMFAGALDALKTQRQGA